MIVPSPPPTLFERLGGPRGVGAAVEAFYRRVTADALLAPWFTGVDLPRLITHQRWFLTAALGGPDRYRGRDLGAAHRDLAVTDEAFDRVAEHLAAALAEVGAGEDDIATAVAAVAQLRSVIVAKPSDDTRDAQAVGTPTAR